MTKTTMPDEEAAGRRVDQIAMEAATCRGGLGAFQLIVRAAWIEATEAAALKWKADAERYQWLKEERPYLIETICFKYKDACADEVNAKGLDAIVDAARAAAMREGEAVSAEVVRQFRVAAGK